MNKIPKLTSFELWCPNSVHVRYRTIQIGEERKSTDRLINIGFGISGPAFGISLFSFLSPVRLPIPSLRQENREGANAQQYLRRMSSSGPGAV